MTHKKHSLLLLVFLFSALWCWGSEPAPSDWYRYFDGFKYVTNYPATMYHAASQNWAILQDKRGILYFGNQAVLLIFDGVSWDYIHIPNKTIRSMDHDRNGTIYIGGMNEIGYLEPDSAGFLQYISLMPQLAEKDRNFTDVFQTHCTSQGVWFRTTDKLFRWYNGKFTVWDMGGSKNKIKTVFSWQGNCYLQQGNLGIMACNGTTLRQLPGTEPFSQERIIMALPRDDHKLLLGIRDKGFYIYDGTTILPFPTEADNYLRDNMLSYCIRLTNGDFAAATLKGGVVVFDSNGRLKTIFTHETSGLADDNVKYILEDSSGNLWLGLNNGIARIDYTSPVYFFDQSRGLTGLILSLARHKERLYVGSTTGLHYLECQAPGLPSRFRSVPGINGSVWSLLPLEDSLLVATTEAVVQVWDDARVAPVIRDIQPYVLSASTSFPNRVWVATDNNVIALRSEKKSWTKEFTLDCQQTGIRSMVEDNNGALWLGTLIGVLKVECGGATGTLPPRLLHYGENHGLPKGEIHSAQVAGHIVFATPLGLYRFNTTSHSFIPDLTLGKNFCDGSRNLFRLAQDRNGHIWFHSELENFLAMNSTSHTLKVYPVVFPMVRDSQVNTIYPDQEKIWFGLSDGLVCYDSGVFRDKNPAFSALVREVTIKDRDLFYGGFKSNQFVPSHVPILQYKNRNLRFDVAAPFFVGSGKVLFRYLMQGFDESWSSWSDATYKSYTNLDAGKYTFRVQAKDIYGDLSREDSFSFRILPPFYLTWWAFVVYVMVAFGLIYLLVKWRSAKLVKETQRLERVVEDRTRQINDANIQLQHKTELLQEQSEQLKEMDNVKSRFFANISHEFRTPLSLIMGPLDQMRAQTSDQTTIKQMDLAYRNAQRLLGLINQLLDLAKLESGKMKLQAELRDLPVFLKALLEAFQLIAQRQQVELVFTAEKESIPIFFDVEKMEKIMLNLLSNALKFTAPGGKIIVSVSLPIINPSSEPAPYVDISVADTGTGIPSDQLEHIFDRFYQGTTTREHRQKGSGIGLSLTKELVELHQGEITVCSSTGDEMGQNSGSVFFVRLPLGNTHLVPTELMHVNTAENTIDIINTINTINTLADRPEFNLTEVLTRATATQSLLEIGDERFDDLKSAAIDESQNQGKEYKDIILIVEDNDDLRYYIRSSLGSGYIVEEAKDGREGIEKAKSIVPDLIISDIMMPEVDGYELLRVIKNDITTSHIPVVMLTAKTSEASILQGLEIGADDYITKPFNTRVLCARVKNLIELRRQLQQNMNREMVMQPSQMKISKIDSQFLADVQRVIEKNLSEPDFNVEDLSRRLDMSRTTVYRKILALCGETPTDYIRSYRLKRAAQLFKTNFGSVTEVAFEVGFTSRAYFTKCFKEKFHRLPSEFPASFDAGGQEHFS